MTVHHLPPVRRVLHFAGSYRTTIVVVAALTGELVLWRIS